MARVVFTLPLPPSTNNLYLNSRGRRKTFRYGQWLIDAGKEVMVQRVGQRLPLVGEIAVTVLLARCTRGDIDNRLKGILDLFTKMAVWGDDSQVARIVIERSPATNLPIHGCMVTLQEISGQRLEDMGQGPGRAASD